MSAFCPDSCPDADACVVGYPCALFPKKVDNAEEVESPDRGSVDVRVSGDGVAPQGHADGRMPEMSSGQGVDLHDRFGC